MFLFALSIVHLHFSLIVKFFDLIIRLHFEVTYFSIFNDFIFSSTFFVLRDAITDMGLHFLAKMKIMVVRDVERDEVEFICKVYMQIILYNYFRSLRFIPDKGNFS